MIVKLPVFAVTVMELVGEQIVVLTVVEAELIQAMSYSKSQWLLPHLLIKIVPVVEDMVIKPVITVEELEKNERRKNDCIDGCLF